MGTYQPGEGKTSCLPCPTGFNSRRTGLEDLNSCKGKLLYSNTQCFTGQWLKIKTNSTYRPECRDTSGTFMRGPHEYSKSFRMAAGQTIQKMNWKRQTARTWSQKRKKCLVSTENAALRQYGSVNITAVANLQTLKFPARRIINRVIETSKNWLAHRSCYEPTIRSIRAKTNENRNEKLPGRFPLIDGRFITESAACKTTRSNGLRRQHFDQNSIESNKNFATREFLDKILFEECGRRYG